MKDLNNVFFCIFTIFTQFVDALLLCRHSSPYQNINRFLSGLYKKYPSVSQAVEWVTLWSLPPPTLEWLIIVKWYFIYTNQEPGGIKHWAFLKFYARLLLSWDSERCQNHYLQTCFSISKYVHIFHMMNTVGHHILSENTLGHVCGSASHYFFISSTFTYYKFTNTDQMLSYWLLSSAWVDAYIAFHTIMPVKNNLIHIELWLVILPHAVFFNYNSFSKPFLLTITNLLD